MVEKIPMCLQMGMILNMGREHYRREFISLERWDERSGAWSMFQGVVSETSLEGLVLGLWLRFCQGSPPGHGRHWWSLRGLTCHARI